MKRLIAIVMSVAVSSVFGSLAHADDDAAKCAETLKLFQAAGESANYFKSSNRYAVFPTIGKAGLGIGGAAGQGAYQNGKQVGTATMTQVSFGWQAGAQGYSLLVFLEDERAFKEFTSGDFEFGAKASAVAITAGASAGAGTSGTSAGASAGKKDATTKSRTGYEGRGLVLDHQGRADVRGRARRRQVQVRRALTHCRRAAARVLSQARRGPRPRVASRGCPARGRSTDRKSACRGIDSAPGRHLRDHLVTSRSTFAARSRLTSACRATRRSGRRSRNARRS